MENQIYTFAPMNNGYLSQYFEAVAAKTLSAVEINPNSSHQHEFNGTKQLKNVLKTRSRTHFPTTFLWIEGQNEGLSCEEPVTWYDARENHPTRSEYRLYFPKNVVMSMATEGDTMFIARRTDDTLLIIVTASGSTIESQLFWLFGLEITNKSTFSSSMIEGQDHELDYATRFILDELGIEVEEPEADQLDRLLLDFNGKFPPTSIFSAFTRTCFIGNIDPLGDPDSTLLALMDWEEKLFRRLERHIISKRLKEGFDSGDDQDVDNFISFSLSVQNRRKSRAGYAFENHLTYILENNGVKFSRKIETENKAKPDFLFPNIAQYRDSSFPANLLTMLGAKTTCKDRWRQVLTEAGRISEKHLLTLEPGISENQTNEMKANQIQLILPSPLHTTFTSAQQLWLMNIKSFIQLVKERQNRGVNRMQPFRHSKVQQPRL